MHSHFLKPQIFKCSDPVMLASLSEFISFDFYTEYDTLYSLNILSALPVCQNTHDALSQSIELIRYKLALALL